MKRKLVSYDALKKMEQTSLTNVLEELIESQEVLANATETEGLELVFFNESEVVYRTTDEDFVKANYRVEDKSVVFENIEQIVVDEDSERQESKKILSSMIDDLIENKTEDANAKIAEYFNLPNFRRNLTEGWKVKVSRPTGKRSKLWHKKQPRSLVAKRIRAMLKTKRKRKALKNYLKTKTAPFKKRLKGTNNPRARLYVVKTMKEWNTLTENVIGYVNHKEMGPFFKECQVESDENGNITKVVVPTVMQKNEGKVLSFDWKTLDSEVKVLRSKAKKLDESEKFAKHVVEIKKANNISDNNGLEVALENVVANFPEVLYLTQSEMTSTVKTCLEMVNTRNFDDNTCGFIAEAILRTAFEAYTDRVNKVSSLAGVKLEGEDSYVEFKNVTDKFYDYLDKSEEADMKVFEDLYEALKNLTDIASNLGNEEIVGEAKTLMAECIQIINKEQEPDIQLAEFVANYLRDIYESNLGSEEWKEMDPHVSVTGDHPMLKAHAQKSYSPASDLHGDDVSDAAPVSDGKNVKSGLADDMGNNAWGNIGGDDVYPSLNNPYIPDAMEFTMKGEKGVDKDDEDLGTNQGKDTWPNLQNPLAK